MNGSEPELSAVLALAALPAVGNLVGCAVAEFVSLSERALSLALHLAAGVVLAVVGLELMPRAMEGAAPWLSVVAFVAGGAAFLGLERIIGYVHTMTGADEQQARPLAIFTGVSLDLFSDGVMIGTATVINPSLGLLLALGQVPADVPEGIAAMGTLRSTAVARRSRWLFAIGFTVPVMVGALVGFYALRSAPEMLTLAVLAMTGGALVTVVIEEMVPQAHVGQTSTYGAIFLTAGFALFAATSLLLGGS